MKKLYYLMLIMTALLLTACGKIADVTESPATTAPTEPTTPPITAPQQDNISPDVPPSYENMYSVALPIDIENRYSEDDTLTSRFLSQRMDLIIPDSEVAQKVIYNFYDRNEQARLDAETLHELAESMYQNGTHTAPLSYDVHYDVTRIDQGVLSLFGLSIQSGEGSHTNVQSIAANYNLVSGDVLKLGSILYHADAKQRLHELVIEVLEARTDITLFDEYPDTVAKHFAKDESEFENFYFSTTGLCIFFSPYEIAPRSYNTVIAEIPYQDLVGVIADEYFPGERIYANGTVTVIPFTTEESEVFSQFADIVADKTENAVKIFLKSDSVIQNVRIHEVIREGSGAYITQTKNVFASNILPTDAAILFQADFSNVLPRYVLSYTSDGSTKFYYFKLDTTTNNIILEPTEEKIEIRSGT